MAAKTYLKDTLAISLFFVVLTFAGTAHAKIIYVDDNAPGANDGSSWENAYNFLQDALATAYNGDEIYVAQGIYKPDGGAGITPGDREATFQLKNGVTIKGGYAGYNEPDPNARDIELYKTILTGDLAGNDVEVNDLSDLWDEPTRADNSYHVVTGSGTDATAILDGFTVTAGNANGSFWTEYACGGGLYSYFCSSPRIISCNFTGNTADRSGGGIYNHDNSNPTLTKCSINFNSATYGGGMSNDTSNATLIHCRFRGNSATYSGGGMHNYYASPTLTNCIFIGNLADYGGGMYNWHCTVILRDCTFAENSANNGKGLGCYSYQQQYPSNVQLTNCILWDGGNEIWNNDNSAITITYSDVQGGWPGTGNIDDDPLFVDADGPDNVAGTEDDNLRLQPGSPCIDAGDPNYIEEPNETDLDGKPRVIGGRIDMGAYEYWQLVPAEVRIVPRTINLASKGKWLTCYIWLPEDYNVADIDPNSVVLEQEIKAESFQVDEQDQVAIARFSRSEVQGILNIGEVELTITSQLTDGTIFEATDVIRVIDKAGKK